MTLPINFRFSQASLSDYLDCPRRFQLRYLLEQAWPAVESEPLLERERLAELGRRFHKLIQQHVEGLSIEALTESISEPELVRWWQRYLDSLNTTLSDLPQKRRAEVAMSIPISTMPLRSEHPSTSSSLRSESAQDATVLRSAQDASTPAVMGGYRLAAHFDLIASDDERAVIVDWKTEQRRSTREQLMQRVQTRVYRYVLTLAQQRPPGTVSMIYWFAQYPDQPIALPYDAAQHADDHRFLIDVIAEIEALARDSQPSPGSEWPKTPDERKCAYCVYRSLCNRGVHAGTSEPDEEDFDLVARINIEQIDAIEY
jgi:CRISPR/Cas system-associated exonuclease Cas4 (RecB family)